MEELITKVNENDDRRKVNSNSNWNSDSKGDLKLMTGNTTMLTEGRSERILKQRRQEPGGRHSLKMWPGSRGGKWTRGAPAQTGHVSNLGADWPRKDQRRAREGPKKHSSQTANGTRAFPPEPIMSHSIPFEPGDQSLTHLAGWLRLRTQAAWLHNYFGLTQVPYAFDLVFTSSLAAGGAWSGHLLVYAGLCCAVCALLRWFSSISKSEF